MNTPKNFLKRKKKVFFIPLVPFTLIFFDINDRSNQKVHKGGPIYSKKQILKRGQGRSNMSGK